MNIKETDLEKMLGKRKYKPDVILSEARKKALAKENEIIASAKAEAAGIVAHAKKEAELEIAGKKVKIAVVSGLGNARKLMEKVKNGEVDCL